MEKKIFVMISVAAEEAGMHPQTLRIYESRGLINPKRSNGNTRLYCKTDIERLKSIQRLSNEGIGLNGIEKILDLEEALLTLKKQYVEQAKLYKNQTRLTQQLRYQLRDALDELEIIVNRNK